MKLKQRPSRIIIDKISPQIENGKFAAKRFLNEEVEISVVLLLDGHDHVKGRMLYRHESDGEYTAVPLRTTPADQGNDVWRARFTPNRLGRYWINVEAVIDRFDTWRTDLQKRFLAGQDLSVDLLIGAELLERMFKDASGKDKKRFEQAARRLRSLSDQGSRLTSSDLSPIIDNEELNSASEAIYNDDSYVRNEWEIPLQVEPELAKFSAWYEFFPRSVTEGEIRHAGFREAEERLEYIKDLGFNVVYLPPIHPIGDAFRKGKNNSLEPTLDDVGSPWAIGSKQGGHKAIHPELGSFNDFQSFLDKARSLNLNVALDIAFQCSPDHPYVKEHPDWFKKRPDGSIQYAENPPKKYQDIYPFDFETDDWKALWNELRDVVQFWIDQGVKVFRIDNPHTKPFHFWEWLIGEIKSSHPDVVFLSEAFTRPKVMAYLAKSGFTQSYTYFTWRNVKWELIEYLQQLTQTELRDYFGANFWPNTPDILPYSLQESRWNVYAHRFILAATLSSNYGIYGPAFELMEHRKFKDGGEEYLNSEKYELKRWNLNQSHSLAPLIKQVNGIRNSFKALQNNASLRFHTVPNDMLLAYSKSYKDQRLLIVVNLDPERVQAGMVDLPLDEWGVDGTEQFEMEDLLTGKKYYWMGWRNYVELRPENIPAHIFRFTKINNQQSGRTNK